MIYDMLILIGLLFLSNLCLRRCFKHYKYKDNLSRYLVVVTGFLGAPAGLMIAILMYTSKGCDYIINLLVGDTL